jgi:hypothetical protein
MVPCGGMDIFKGGRLGSILPLRPCHAHCDPARFRLYTLRRDSTRPHMHP